MADVTFEGVLARLQAVSDAIEGELKARAKPKAETAKADAEKAKAETEKADKPEKPPHLRTGGKDPDKDGIPDECSTCAHFKGGQSGTCQLYDYAVDGGEVCDSYEAKASAGKKEVLLQPASIKLLTWLGELIEAELASRETADGKTE